MSGYIWGVLATLGLVNVACWYVLTTVRIDIGELDRGLLCSLFILHSLCILSFLVLDLSCVVGRF